MPSSTFAAVTVSRYGCKTGSWADFTSIFASAVFAASDRLPDTASALCGWFLTLVLRV